MMETKIKMDGKKGGKTRGITKRYRERERVRQEILLIEEKGIKVERERES